jgi:hypothetical protein
MRHPLVLIIHCHADNQTHKATMLVTTYKVKNVTSLHCFLLYAKTRSIPSPKDHATKAKGLLNIISICPEKANATAAQLTHLKNNSSFALSYKTIEG